MKLNIAVIYGSVRTGRQGIKAAKFVAKKLEERGHKVALVDPLQYKLPFLDKMYKEFEKGKAPEMMEKLAQILENADGFIVVSAEYNHSLPAVLKNLLDHYQSEYFFKPSGIVTYSAGPFGGVRVAVHLRAIMGELGSVSIPSMFPISKVHDSFDDDGNPKDEAYNRRIVKFLDEFEWYGCALKIARDKEKVSEDNVPLTQSMCRKRPY
ncbi:NADPH-dependent FMN reductase [Candidatus Woesearchaeota archaeon]|jgi:NAD(P)H-dependent FMN reductase|nr:NADPH-dependent FMN reductase [Candidatus Woesearchaeota archaeon]MAG91790.1 NADPH-dependent FMN reductase [Candidatus Woesearchaeota archaeon]|tara:strand:- start:23162 stop:23788 length:627 start_codon:yes stop_codon:yes gene_type:complete